jgi:hypothetical protein
MNRNLNYIIGGLMGIVLTMIFDPLPAVAGIIGGGVIGEILDNRRKLNVP